MLIRTMSDYVAMGHGRFVDMFEFCADMLIC